MPIAALLRSWWRGRTAPPTPTGVPAGFEITLRTGSIGALVSTGAIEDLPLAPPETVPLPPIAAGRDALAQGPVRESQPHIAWDQPAYRSYPLQIFRIRDARVFGAIGITAAGDEVLAETLWHTHPERHRYRMEDGAITLSGGAVEALPGRTISLLGYAGNYFHALVEGVARIAAIPDDMLAEADRILLPEGDAVQAELIARYRLPPGLRIRFVAPGETLRLETLLFPWSVHGLFEYHPRLCVFFDRVLAALPADRPAGPRRIYIDRRGTSQRPLVNEAALIAALEILGIVPVRLESLTVTGQAALFRDADLVVAPHGAGLTNLGFAGPGCSVVELMLDAYLNWCYRHLAGLRGLGYDCVIGQALGPWNALDLTIHGQTWQVSVDAVLDAVRTAIARAGSA